MHKALQKKKNIQKLVEDNPGLGFIDIQKDTGYANGVLSHHLKTLSNEGHIRIKQGNRKIWIFSSEFDSTNDDAIIFLRKETCRKILVFLLQTNLATFSEIQKAIERSPSTTSLTMKKLLDHKLIRRTFGFPHKYALENQDKIRQIIQTTKISEINALKDRFADTFSYY